MHRPRHMFDILHHLQTLAIVGSRSNRDTNGVNVNTGHSRDRDSVVLCAQAGQHVLHHLQIAAPVGSRSNRGTNGVKVNRGNSWDGERA